MNTNNNMGKETMTNKPTERGYIHTHNTEIFCLLPEMVASVFPFILMYRVVGERLKE